MYKHWVLVGAKFGKTVTLFALLLLAQLAHVQARQSNQRCKWVVFSEAAVRLDTLLIDEQSLVVSGYKGDYTFDSRTATLTLNASVLPDSLQVCYRVYPAYITRPYQHRTYHEYDSLAPFSVKKQPVAYQREQLFETEGIYKSGSITRGISVGNSRSVGVTSSLNFQMEGQLTEDLNIRANITDQNVPFQPEGNTQQLREFDNVSIEVYNEKLSLKAGDIVLQNSSSQFLKYYKNVQGGQFSVDYEVGEKAKARSTVTVSAAKGQFADITLQVAEGVQGPYKLRGPNGERFIIVLANSETLYLDGRPLERGFNKDYVIDYNLGEITFNPSVLITRFSRVRATYEYSERSYNRAIINTTHELTTDNTTLTFNHYQESDAKNSPLSFDLSNDDKLAISQAGEENLPVPIPGFKEVAFSPEAVLYQKKDTLDGQGNAHEVFEFSRDSTRQLYRVVFSEVGLGKGDYQLVANTVNGREYEWVAPEMGISQGSYAPVTFVPAPNKKQMTTMGVAVKLSEYSQVYSELAFSHHDLNLYSPLGNDDNRGMAIKSGWMVKNKPVEFLQNYTLSSVLDVEYDSKNFQGIDRFRYIEFNRDWNVANDQTSAADHHLNLSATLRKDARNEWAYRLSGRKRTGQMQGTQQELKVNQQVGYWQLLAGGYSMHSSQKENQARWQKAHGEVSWKKWGLVPGYRFELDQNTMKNHATDSVLSSAMHYTSHGLFLQSNDSLPLQLRAEHTWRNDKQPEKGSMQDFATTHTSRLVLDASLAESQQLEMTMTYRQLIYRGVFAANRNEETVLGKLNWQGQFFNGLLTSDLSYATASSREIRRDYVFVPVVSGEGTHTWRDLNGDGIQDITEFFEAIHIDERNYIKLFVPTDKFVPAYNNQLNWNLRAAMPRAWREAGGIRQVLGRLSSRTTVSINKKNTDRSFNSRFNPFQLTTDQTRLIFVKDAIRSNWFYNRSNPGFGVELGYFQARSRQLISDGIEARKQQEWTVNARKRLTTAWNLLWVLERGYKENTSDFIQGRNYALRIRSLAPQLTWQPTASFRVSTRTTYKHKTNTWATDTDEWARLSSVDVGVRWSKALKNTLDATFKIVDIDFEGEVNSLAGYELLEALRPGTNYTWNFSFRQKLANGLQLSATYDGRKPDGQRMVHLGRMQITALF